MRIIFVAVALFALGACASSSEQTKSDEPAKTEPATAEPAGGGDEAAAKDDDKPDNVKPNYVKCDPERPEMPCTPDSPGPEPAPADDGGEE